MHVATSCHMTNNKIQDQEVCLLNPILGGGGDVNTSLKSVPGTPHV
jgi:hypothetical protein